MTVVGRRRRPRNLLDVVTAVTVDEALP